MKNPEKVKQGKRNRAMGADFERRVRKDLEGKGWIVDKWSNTVEIMDVGVSPVSGPARFGKLIPAKRKYAGPGRPLAIGTGFPDFIAFYNDIVEYELTRDISPVIKGPILSSAIIGIECKTNGYLDKVEKEKCKWLLDNNIFSKILIASKHKIKNRIHIEYKEWHPGNECHKIN